jgi:hypothetical protein
MDVVVKQLFAATKGAFFEVILPAFGPLWDYLQKVTRATKVVVVVKFRAPGLKYFTWPAGCLTRGPVVAPLGSRDHRYTKSQIPSPSPRMSEKREGGQEASPKRESGKRPLSSPISPD